MMMRIACSLILIGALVAPAQASDRILVFAAASLQTALDRIVGDWEGGREVVVSYASSAALARQIAAGAPADIFISANADWMDWLDSKHAIQTPTRRNLASNSLVVVTPGMNADRADTIGPETDLGEGRIAMGLVDAVPAGIYGKAALQSLGLWDDVAPRAIQTDNVRTALAFVARGEAEYGIVYRSDAFAEPRVHIRAVFPMASHPPIVYPAALTAKASDATARAFLDHLSGEAARSVFAETGFADLEAAHD